MTNSIQHNSCPSRLRPPLQQPVDQNLPTVSFPSIVILPQHNNQSLHYYDQDVVRELSIPPDSSLTTTHLPRFLPPVHGSHFPSPDIFETSRFPQQPTQHVSSIAFQQSSLRTPPVNLLLQHGLPSSLPPPPRTTFVAPQSQLQQQLQQPDSSSIQNRHPSDLVQILDSLLRGSYNNMLANKNDTSIPGATTTDASASAVENSAGGAIDFNFEDLLVPDVFDEYLTSPQLDQSPDETPFIDTPLDETFGSPALFGIDLENDSFSYDHEDGGMPPPFGAIIWRQKEEEAAAGACAMTTDSTASASAIESFPFSPYITSPLPNIAPSLPDDQNASKILLSTPVPPPPPLETAEYSFQDTPSMSPALLLTPATPPVSLPLSANNNSTATANTLAPPKQQRPVKPLPTGIRRGITPASLVPLDAPTQTRQYATPSATSRKEVPAAFLNKGKKRERSQVSSSPGEDNDHDDATEGMVQLDENTKDAIETKRRQNTLAARRSRARKLEHVRELEDTLALVTQDRDMWMARAYEAENKLRVHGLS